MRHPLFSLWRKVHTVYVPMSSHQVLLLGQKATIDSYRRAPPDRTIHPFPWVAKEIPGISLTRRSFCSVMRPASSLGRFWLSMVLMNTLECLCCHIPRAFLILRRPSI